ncbi:MAG: hypothetical protein ACI840_002686, partial [Ulvibacter sp.]
DCQSKVTAHFLFIGTKRRPAGTLTLGPIKNNNKNTNYNFDELIKLSNMLYHIIE